MELAGHEATSSTGHETSDGKAPRPLGPGPAANRDGASLLINADGEVEHLDAGAAAWLAKDGPLYLRGRRLCAFDEAVGALLDAVLAAVARRGGPTEVTIALPEPGNAPPSRWRVTPYGEFGGCRLSLRSAAPTLDRGFKLHSLARRGFTAAEAACALLIVEGLSIDQVAARQGISRNTVRAHLRSLYAKTGTHRQAALAALVNRALAGAHDEASR
ncbi:MAG: helix-turn-helix transcriptional regulator [Gammaproteobacteria bacterium]